MSVKAKENKKDPNHCVMTLQDQQNIFVLRVTSETPQDPFGGRSWVYAQRLSINTGHFQSAGDFDLLQHI